MPGQAMLAAGATVDQPSFKMKKNMFFGFYKPGCFYILRSFKSHIFKTYKPFLDRSFINQSNILIILKIPVLKSEFGTSDRYKVPVCPKILKPVDFILYPFGST